MKLFRSLILCALAAGALAAPVRSLADIEAVDDAELAEQRGGVLVAGSLAFQFGAVLSTYEDGALSLQTQVTWTPNGPVVQQFVAPGVTPVADPGLSALAGLGEAFQTPGGAVVLHDLAGGQFLNLLLNTQSNHDVRQDLAITLVLPGFGATQEQMSRDLTALRLAGDMASGAMAALAH